MALFPWVKSKKKRDVTSLSLAEARFRRGEVVHADLRRLNVSVSEKRFENSFTNAEAAFLKGEFEIAAALLLEIKQSYADARVRTLHASMNKKLSRKESRALAARQAGIQEVLAGFDGVINALHLKASKEVPWNARSGAVTPPAIRLPEGFLERFKAAEGAPSQSQVIDEYFDLGPVSTTGDAKPGALYALRQGESLTLLATADRFPATTVIPIHDALSGKRLKPLPIREFLALGRSEALVALHKLVNAAGEAQSAEKNGSPYQHVPLDLSAFNQLVLAADHSGLVSSVLVSNARDQYFRREKYQNAFAAVERLYQEFAAKAAQRTATLQKEQQDYKRGRLEMSPKKWQEKQARDTAQTQRVERTRKHFKLVLDGLRLLHLRQQQAQG
jgi:hypothetical protein